MAAFENSWFVARVSYGGSGGRTAELRGGHRLSRQVGDALIEVSYGGAAHMAVDEVRDLAVLVHGDIYEPYGPDPAAMVLNEYALDPTRTWTTLNGSMAVLVLDGRRQKVMAVTDRINSRKVFVSRDNGGWWLSSSLQLHPTEGLSIDPGAVASFLINSVVHNNKTPFREISVLPRASVHTLSRRDRDSSEYWRYEFTGDHRPASNDELRGQLSELLRESVRRRVATVDGRLFISMSGGYDSKAVAAFLAEIAGTDRLGAFTYHHGPRIGDVDAPAAEMASRFLGIDHQTVDLYDGDVMRVLAANSTLGQGMKFAKETDFWDRVLPLVGAQASNALFVADNPFGMKQRRSEGAKDDILGLVNIYPVRGIEWFLSQVPAQQAQTIRDSWEQNLVELRNRVPDYEDPRDSQSFMYLDQRIGNFLTLWRECFQMPFARVFNPYMDNDILDFVRSVPADMKDGKILYKEALTSAFPDLFRLEVSVGGFGLPTFGDDFRAHHQQIKAMLDDHPSRLDELIPPEAIYAVIQSRSASMATGLDRMKRIGKQVPKRIVTARRAVRKFKSHVKAASTHNVPWTDLVFIALTLRGFLETDRLPSDYPIRGAAN